MLKCATITVYPETVSYLHFKVVLKNFNFMFSVLGSHNVKPLWYSDTLQAGEETEWTSRSKCELF